jgi:hypothetical protein
LGVRRESGQTLGHITAEVVDQFRVGHFDSANKLVQEAWLFCMVQLLPCVNKLWGGMMRSSLLSEKDKLCGIRPTCSDEALISWFFHTYYESSWKALIAKDLEKMNATGSDDSSQGRAKKRMKRGQAHPEVANYFRTKSKIALAKADSSHDAKSWEKAVQRRAQEQFEDESRTRAIQKILENRRKRKETKTKKWLQGSGCSTMFEFAEHLARLDKPILPRNYS